MVDIKSYITYIKDTISALISNDMLPDYIDLQHFQDHQGYNDFTIILFIGRNENISVELKIWEMEDTIKAYIQVYDFPEESKPLLFPKLKEYLLKHPLLQFPNYPDGQEIEYYLNKSIPPEYAREIYISLALIVQDFYTDPVWYI